MVLFVHIVLLIVGSAMILVGANYFTGAAATVARRIGVSDFVIGLTLVSIGSSAPDLAVGVLSAIRGHTQFALGNVVGSCIFDGLLVVGCVALIHPLQVSRDMIRKQLPYLILSYIIVIVCANSFPRTITRGDGILMLLFFGMILWQELSQRPNQKLEGPAKPKPVVAALNNKKKILLAVEIIGGLGALVWGGNLFVSGAAGIADEAHISQTVIGLTVVALGTSLPDLATSAVAAWRHNPGIAIGNVVGSCMMDALMVLGCSAIVRPLPLGGVNNIDLGVMTGGAVLLLVFAVMRKCHTVGRWAGALFVALYASYMLWVVLEHA